MFVKEMGSRQSVYPGINRLLERAKQVPAIGKKEILDEFVQEESVRE